MSYYVCESTLDIGNNKFKKTEKKTEEQILVHFWAKSNFFLIAALWNSLKGNVIQQIKKPWPCIRTCLLR